MDTKALPPWIWGMTADRPRDAPAVIDTVAGIVLGRFDGMTRRAKLEAAETGLGIKSSWYWYIAAAHKAYSYMIFFFDVAPARCKGKIGGVCPFDSGGLWGGHIPTESPLTTRAQKRAFFRHHDRQLDTWINEFQSYVVRNYTSPGDYVRGKKPKRGTTGIVLRLASDSRAWTWEGRIKTNQASDTASLTGIIISDFEVRDIRTRLRSSSRYDRDAKKMVVMNLNAAEVVSVNPSSHTVKDRVRSRATDILVELIEA